MRDYKHIATFAYPYELAIAKSVLEANEIACYVRDELTVQVHNFYSNAIGGIRLEVPLSQSETAIKILVDSGYEIFLAEDFDSPYMVNNETKINKFLKLSIVIVIALALILILTILYLLL